MAVRGVHAPVRQSVALEPEMLVRLEEYIQETNKQFKVYQQPAHI